MQASPRILTTCLLLAVVACGDDSTGPTTPPSVLTSGTLSVAPSFQVDLDTGTLQGDATADLWNTAATATDVSLASDNGATLAAMGTTEPDYATCAAAAFSATPVQIFGATVPRHFCFKTNQGRISRVTLTKAPDASDIGIVIDYTTWNLGS